MNSLINRWLKRIAYNPFLVRLSRFMGLRRWLRKIYYKLSVPEGKIIKIRFEGINASFNVGNPVDLRSVEVPFQKGVLGDERLVLETLLQTLQSGDVVYDIGAHIGVHTIFMAKRVGKNGWVIAFEPEVHSFEILQENVSLNDLENVKPIQIALGDRLGEGMLYWGGVIGGFSLMGPLKNSLGQEIKIMPGDMLVKDENLPLPRVVKIDVEGYEYYVITGLQNTLSNKICKMVCCEIHPTLLPSNIKPNMVIDLLKSYGFNRIETHPRGVTFHVFCYKGWASTVNNFVK